MMEWHIPSIEELRDVYGVEVDFIPESNVAIVVANKETKKVEFLEIDYSKIGLSSIQPQGFHFQDDLSKMESFFGPSGCPTSDDIAWVRGFKFKHDSYPDEIKVKVAGILAVLVKDSADAFRIAEAFARYARIKGNLADTYAAMAFYFQARNLIAKGD